MIWYWFSKFSLEMVWGCIGCFVGCGMWLLRLLVGFLKMLVGGIMILVMWLVVIVGIVCVVIGNFWWLCCGMSGCRKVGFGFWLYLLLCCLVCFFILMFVFLGNVVYFFIVIVMFCLMRWLKFIVDSGGKGCL